MRRCRLLLAGLWLGVGCGGPHEPAGAQPDVLFLTVDTFRADRAGCLGNPDGLTPTLDRLARRGILAREAFAPVPLTAPSHATLLTGLEPPHHGVRENGMFTLADTTATLPELLREHGFVTGAFVAAFPLIERFGFAQGFDEFDASLGPGGQTLATYAERPAARVVDAALAWAESLPASARWFLWAHFFDPHQPYEVKRALRRLPVAGDYEREIRGMDLEIRRLVRGVTLNATGRGPITVVASDHGEGLGDHGESTHGVLLFDEALRALVSVTDPATPERGRIETRLVRHADVFPTLLDALAIDVPASIDGQSLFEADPHEGAYGESYYPWLHYGWSPLLCWRDETWTYIDAPTPLLFDRTRDPAETENVASAYAEVVTRLAGMLSAWREDPEAPGEELDPEAAEKLLALGYVASGGGAPPDLGKDPHELIDSIERLFRGMNLQARGNPTAALSYFEQAVRADPDNVTAVFYLANCLRTLGRPNAARTQYREAVRLNPRAAEAWGHLAGVEQELGDPDAARRVIAEGLDRNSEAFPILMTAGDLAFARGELEQAVEFYERAHTVEPTRVEPHAARALLEEARGQSRQAALAWERALALDPNHAMIPPHVRSRMKN